MLPEVRDALGLIDSAFDTADPGIGLWKASLAAGAPMTCQPNGTYLDVGCCEADWLHMAHRAWPDALLHGVDWRAPNVTDGDGKVTRRQGNALDPNLYAPESVDGIVSLSAVEHFGLGHYGSDGNKDPRDADGDTHIIENCWRWLKLGGWLYFDVPYTTREYRVCGTGYRLYDDAALRARLLWCRPWTLAWRGYANTWDTGAIIERPETEPEDGRLYYYTAVCWVKTKGDA